MSDKDDKDIEYRLKPNVIVKRKANDNVVFSVNGKKLSISEQGFQDLFTPMVKPTPVYANTLPPKKRLNHG